MHASASDPAAAHHADLPSRGDIGAKGNFQSRFRTGTARLRPAYHLYSISAKLFRSL